MVPIFIINTQSLHFHMTTASFYKQDGQQQGIYFQLPEDQLARELKSRKAQEHSRALKADKVINENHEIKELRQKIQQGYLNKERSKQLAEKQVRKVDELVHILLFRSVRQSSKLRS